MGEGWLSWVGVLSSNLLCFSVFCCGVVVVFVVFVFVFVWCCLSHSVRRSNELHFDCER